VQKIDEAGHRPSRSRFSNGIVGHRDGVKLLLLVFRCRSGYLTANSRNID
jgi:hypothetical protein